MANDDPILTTMRFIPQHEVVQRYGAILPDNLTTPAMKDTEAYKTYHDLATGKVQLKPKYVRRYSRSKTKQAPKPPSDKGVKETAKVAKSGKKKQPALGLETLSEVALTEAEQMKLATKRSLIQTHSSHASGSGAHEGTGVTPGVPDVPTYESDEEKLSWKSSDEDEDDNAQDDDDDQSDDDEQTESDNDGDDFVHPKLSTHDDEAGQDEEVHDEESDEVSDEEDQGAHIVEEEVNEEMTNEEDEANELYRDVNVNLEGRDTEMIDAPLPNVQGTQVTEDTHVIITASVIPEGQQQSSSVSSGFVSNMLNPNPDAGIDSIFNLNIEATSLVDVPVSTIAKPSFLATTTLPPPPTPLITHMQQIPVPTPANVPSSSLQDLPNFGSLFGFDHRLKTMENDFSEFKQINQFDRLREEAQAENDNFLNMLDDNIKKIIKDQVKEQVKTQVSKILPKIEKLVNDQLQSEVLIRSLNEAKTSHAVAAKLSELELKKILIDKMEANKSVDMTNIQKNLYKALVEAYEADKDILDAYGDTVTIKRRRDDADDDEEPSAGSNRGSKRRRAGKEPESTSAPKEKTPKSSGKSTEGSKSHHKSAGESVHVEEPMHTAKDLEEPTYLEFDTGANEDQPQEETTSHPDWFQKLARHPTPDRDWNTTLPDAHGSAQLG
ncbi:hypothetical protein Tco_1576381 [Tanacetum coccineum]